MSSVHYLPANSNLEGLGLSANITKFCKLCSLIWNVKFITWCFQLRTHLSPWNQKHGRKAHVGLLNHGCRIFNQKYWIFDFLLVCYKKDVLRNFAKFTVKRTCRCVFSIIVASLRPATLLKKGLQQRCFSVNFAKFLRTSFNDSRYLDCHFGRGFNATLYQTKTELLIKQSTAYRWHCFLDDLITKMSKSFSSSCEKPSSCFGIQYFLK